MGIQIQIVFPTAHCILTVPVNSLQLQFFLDYLFVSKEKIDFEDLNIVSKFFNVDANQGDKIIQIVASGPDYKESNIRNSYLK